MDDTACLLHNMLHFVRMTEDKNTFSSCLVNKLAKQLQPTVCRLEGGCRFFQHWKEDISSNELFLAVQYLLQVLKQSFYYLMFHFLPKG